MTTSVLSYDNAQEDFVESTSEGGDFSSSDEVDAHLFERVLEGVYSTSGPSSMLDPAQRDSILLFDKDLCELEELVGKVFCLFFY